MRCSLCGRRLAASSRHRLGPLGRQAERSAKLSDSRFETNKKHPQGKEPAKKDQITAIDRIFTSNWLKTIFTGAVKNHPGNFEDQKLTIEY